jgi:hypothetical protein
VVTGVGRGLLHARELGGGMWGNLAARHRWRIFKWGGDIMGKGTEEGGPAWDATWGRGRGPGSTGHEAADTGPSAVDLSGRRWRCMVNTEIGEGGHRQLGPRLQSWAATVLFDSNSKFKRILINFKLFQTLTDPKKFLSQLKKIEIKFFCEGFG